MPSRDPETITVSAPAKVNLTLRVLGRRPDGYHDIESWVAPIDWRDQLAFQADSTLSFHWNWVVAAVESPAGASPSAGAVGGNSIPSDGSNLVCRAARALAAAAGVDPHVQIRLHKSIPPGAGLGGGSSDAAATLLGLNRLWKLNWTVDRLADIAAEIGSDVPLFLSTGQKIIRGRGEKVASLHRGWGGWLAIVSAGFSLSTAEVYRRYPPSLAPHTTRTSPWNEDLGHARPLAAELFNDLEAAAFALEPRLGELHSRLDGLGGRPVRMTGSGSSLFTLFDDPREADSWAREVEPRLLTGQSVRVVRTL